LPNISAIFLPSPSGVPTISLVVEPFKSTPSRV
jgi:hypothetical protein